MQRLMNHGAEHDEYVADFVVKDAHGRDQSYHVEIGWAEDEQCYEVSFLSNDPLSLIRPAPRDASVQFDPLAVRVLIHVMTYVRWFLREVQPDCLTFVPLTDKLERIYDRILTKLEDELHSATPPYFLDFDHDGNVMLRKGRTEVE